MKLLMILLAMVCLSGEAKAADILEKMVMPCISEICIGDGLPELKKVKWERARGHFSKSDGTPSYAGARPLNKYDISLVNRGYRGNVMPAAAYLVEESFDAKALALLVGVTACSGKPLTGRFTTQSGNPTVVQIASVPDETDAAVQRWTVVGIEQTFPAVKTQQQQAARTQELRARYGRFKMTARPKGRVAVFEIPPQGPRNQFYFTLSLVLGVNAPDQYLMHPACGGKQKVNVD